MTTTRMTTTRMTTTRMTTTRIIVNWPAMVSDDPMSDKWSDPNGTYLSVLGDEPELSRGSELARDIRRAIAGKPAPTRC
jgi:hypothetical protein